MVDPDVWNFAIVACIIVCGTGGLAFIATRFIRSLHKPKYPDQLPQGKYDEQIAQLQRSMDAVAVEVERIAEAQRFHTRLLADGLHTSAVGDEK